MRIKGVCLRPLRGLRNLQPLQNAQILHTENLKNGKLPLFTIFWAGFVAGILIMNMGKSILLENTDLLDEATLYRMKYMTVNSNALFYFVLKKRMGELLFLVVASTTYLGIAICIGTAFWYGMAAGNFLSALVLRYGLKGILFALIGTFPQYLLYIPALAALLVWCSRLCRGIYFHKNMVYEKRQSMLKRCFTLAAIILAILCGCFFESYINPGCLSWFLQIF